MRLVYNLILPRSWVKVWKEPPITMAYMSLMMKRHYLPGIAEQMYGENPLMKRLRQDSAPQDSI